MAQQDHIVSIALFIDKLATNVTSYTGPAEPVDQTVYK